MNSLQHLKNSSQFLIVFIVLGCSPFTSSDHKLITFVNPLIGTAISNTESARLHSESGSELKGQTFPAVGVPHGMTHWTPQTRATEAKCISPYYFEDDRIQGFRGSHWLSGSCTQDYGSVSIMPITGPLKIKPEERASAYSHTDEFSAPDYYRVKLKDYNILAELSAATRSSILSFSAENTDELSVIIEPNSDEGEGYIEINPNLHEIIGYNPVHRIYQGRGERAGFSGYFIISFDTPFESYGTWRSDSISIGSSVSKGNGLNTGAFVKFLLKDKKNVKVKVGTSFTSIEGARKNLKDEIPGWDFDEVRAQSAEAWEKELSKTIVSSEHEDDKKMFYTAVYHARLLPRIMNDTDGAYPVFSQDYKIDTTGTFNYYDDFSMWDTYRAVHPLLTIIDPDRVSDMVTSLIKKSEQGGWLPIFPCWNNYTAAMIGDHATSIISEALVKNICTDRAEEAYAAMRKNAFQVNTDSISYSNGKGRRALQSYLQYSYIPLEDSVWESFHKKEQVSRTLEYAYDDFALSQVAKMLSHNDDYQKLITRSENYKNVFDTATGFVRGRYANGNWITPFNPYALRAPFITEGSPFQYTWYVPHDVKGLIKIMGGEKKFISQLDTLFDKRYYWHGNEPGHHTAYLYAYAGAPWKTQHQIHQIIREEYSSAPGGLSGNEDAGQMSAWLVFSMIGLYPVCPAQPYYVLGSPSFKEVVVKLKENKAFKVIAENLSQRNIYIQSAELNGKHFSRTYLLHDELVKGGELRLIMGGTPNKNWASNPASRPPSLSDDNF